MNRLYIIFFTLSCIAWCATISGRVELTDAKVPKGQKKDESGVVAWLEPVMGAPAPTAPAAASVSHKNKTFIPHVTVIRTGSRVTFPNLDPFFHNAFSSYDGQAFDIGLHPPGSTREVRFNRPGIVRLFCNIHPTMSAVIVVLNTPWFAVSNAQGTIRIANVPAGEYRLKLFHERALPDVLVKLERQITVGAEDLTLAALAISEVGYVTPPHKNKFGKDYPPVTVDQYPGSKR
jgi:plastocyanin